MNKYANDRWERIVHLLNNGSEDEDGCELYDCADSLIRSLESGTRMPSNCIIRPGLTKEGFVHLLYLIRNGVDVPDSTVCSRCGSEYDESRGDVYCGLCPGCADKTE